MRKRFAILLGLIALLSVQLVYGDPVETRGKWGDKYYRSINPLPPSLSIQGNILSVDFMNALENLTITITDEQGTVIMEDNISGETGGRRARGYDAGYDDVGDLHRGAALFAYRAIDRFLTIPTGREDQSGAARRDTREGGRGTGRRDKAECSSR